MIEDFVHGVELVFRDIGIDFPGLLETVIDDAVLAVLSASMIGTSIPPHSPWMVNDEVYGVTQVVIQVADYVDEDE